MSLLETASFHSGREAGRWLTLRVRIVARQRKARRTELQGLTLLMFVGAVTGFAGVLVWHLFGRTAFIIGLVGAAVVMFGVAGIFDIGALPLAASALVICGLLTLLVVYSRLFRILRSGIMHLVAPGAGEVVQDVPSLGASTTSPATETRMRQERLQATKAAQWLLGELQRLDEQGDGTTRLFEEGMNYRTRLHGLEGGPDTHDRRLFVLSSFLSSLLMAGAGAASQAYCDRVLAEGLAQLGQSKHQARMQASQAFLSELEAALMDSAKRNPRALLAVKAKLASSQISVEVRLRTALLRIYENRSVYEYS